MLYIVYQGGTNEQQEHTTQEGTHKQQEHATQVSTNEHQECIARKHQWTTRPHNMEVSMINKRTTKRH